MQKPNKEQILITKVKFFLDKTFERENEEKSLRSLFNMSNETLKEIISDFKKIDVNYFENEKEKNFYLEALEKVQKLNK